jgi:hypothetical protein
MIGKKMLLGNLINRPSDFSLLLELSVDNSENRRSISCKMRDDANIPHDRS